MGKLKEDIINKPPASCDETGISPTQAFVERNRSECLVSNLILVYIAFSN
jgi:hypothetical protein